MNQLWGGTMKNYALAVLGGLLLGSAYVVVEQPARSAAQLPPMHRTGAIHSLNVAGSEAPKLPGRGIASKFGSGSSPIRFWAI